MEAGRIIKLLRTMERLSQDEVANDLEVSRAYLSQVENGREPSLAVLKRASARFRIPLSLLVIESPGTSNPELDAKLHDLVKELLAARISLGGYPDSSGEEHTHG